MCEIEFSTRGIHDIFPTTTKKTLIFGIPSNFKYYSTELRTKHTLVAMGIATKARRKKSARQKSVRHKSAAT
jgi:hypothetical protein